MLDDVVEDAEGGGAVGENLPLWRDHLLEDGEQVLRARGRNSRVERAEEAAEALDEVGARLLALGLRLRLLRLLLVGLLLLQLELPRLPPLVRLVEEHQHHLARRRLLRRREARRLEVDAALDHLGEVLEEQREGLDVGLRL